jgi:hypothetical protein
MHWLSVERLTPSGERGPHDDALRAYLNSPDAKAAAAPRAARRRLGRARPAANQPVRGLPAVRRQRPRVRLLP